MKTIEALKLPENIEDLSDGYHTFKELYEHRFTLFIALARVFKRQVDAIGPIHPVDCFAWRSKLHSDDSAFDGWFVMGLGTYAGEQITYHLPHHSLQIHFRNDKAADYDLALR